jgi:phosphohistidine phosphatase SixA
MRRYFRLFAGIVCLFVLVVASFPALAADTIYLVRHAEKVADGSRDPALSVEGIARASHMAEMLADENIVAVFSSDFVRTRETARPLAERLGLDIQIYSPYPADAEAFAAQLRALNGNMLVVGHSNTTPEMTALLSGKSVDDVGDIIDTEELSEYNWIYIVRFNQDGSLHWAGRIDQGEFDDTH